MLSSACWERIISYGDCGLGSFPGIYIFNYNGGIYFYGLSLYNYMKLDIGCGCRCVVAQIIFLYTFCDSQ